MKSYAKFLSEDRWKVYVTDDDYETYTATVNRTKPPTSSEMEDLFKKDILGRSLSFKPVRGDAS